MSDTIDDYILSHIEPEPDYLRQLYRRTYLTTTYPRMCSGHIQGRILAMLSRMTAPRRIIELGTFTGYSALCLAEGLVPGGELHTIEIDDEFEDRLLGQFRASPFADSIHLHIGDALHLLPTLEGPWDLAFIDANKRHYVDYYRLLLPAMRPGGIILADNTLWSGKIAADTPPTDAQSRGIMEFNDLVASDPRVTVAMLPLRDGLTIIRVNSF